MTENGKVDTLVGLFMVVGFMALFYLAMQVSNLGSLDTGKQYQVTAYFDNVGSLKEKAPVTMAGVEVGRVLEITYDKEKFQAEVKLSIYERFDNIPDDTFAKILTAGLLGAQYIGLDPGGSEENLEAGSEIELTQSALVLEEVIGQFLFNKAQDGE